MFVDFYFFVFKIIIVYYIVFYYFYCNNHYCHNSGPLSPCQCQALYVFNMRTLLNGLEQKYFSETFITGPTLRCLCGTAWAPLRHPVHSTSSAS